MTKENICVYCGVPTKNPMFCSRSCSAKHNNKKYPKRKKTQRFCKHCGIELHGRKTVCAACNPQLVCWESVTYGSMKVKYKYQKHSRIRDLARNIYYKADKPQLCRVCGYDKHFEVCHIVPIGKFTDSTPITIINSLDNLVALCPNHHWELDNGLLSLGFPDFDYLHP